MFQNICLKKSVERRDNSPAPNTLSGKLLYLRTKVCEMKPAVPLHSCLPRTAGASKGAFVDISCMIKNSRDFIMKKCVESMYFLWYTLREFIKKNNSNKGNKRKWGEIPRLASNRDAFRTTRRETSYRLDVKISLGQKHTSMRKGKQAKRRFLLQR